MFKNKQAVGHKSWDSTKVVFKQIGCMGLKLGQSTKVVLKQTGFMDIKVLRLFFKKIAVWA